MMKKKLNNWKKKSKQKLKKKNKTNKTNLETLEGHSLAELTKKEIIEYSLKNSLQKFQIEFLYMIS